MCVRDHSCYGKMYLQNQNGTMNKDRVVLSLGRTLFSFSTNYLFKTDVTMAFYCQHTRLCSIISISIMMINACKQEIKTVSCKRYKKNHCQIYTKEKNSIQKWHFNSHPIFQSCVAIYQSFYCHKAYKFSNQCCCCAIFPLTFFSKIVNV